MADCNLYFNQVAKGLGDVLNGTFYKSPRGSKKDV